MLSTISNYTNYKYLMTRELEGVKSAEINLSSKTFTTKAQLQQHIKDDVKIYRLLRSGNIESIKDEEPLQSQEIFLRKNTTQKGPMNFPCSHSMLEKHWLEEDYEFVFA